MTKTQAKAALLQGERLTHPLFTREEYIHEKAGILLDEDGIEINGFWEYRTTDPRFNDGWEIWEPVYTEKDTEDADYWNNGGPLGPTGHGDICYSDADPGL